MKPFNAIQQILILNYEFPPLGGGAGNATYYLLKEFANYSTIHIDLITSSTDTFKIDNFAENIDIHFLDIGKKGNLHYQSNIDLLIYSRKAYNYAKKIMKRKKYDLIHAFFGIPSGFIAMQLGVPYIVSLRGSDVPFYNDRFKWLDKLVFQRLSRRIWKRAAVVVANSDGLRKLALETNPNQTIGVIYNGVNIKEFEPLESKKENEKLTLISTGRLIERKGYQFLIDALKGMVGIRLWLIGGGNRRVQLEEQAVANGVDVQFLGEKAHSEIGGYLQKADIFVLPSLNEGMSNSILEAMACGLPIIATNVGGSEELIKGNGFVVEKGSVKELKEVLQNYLTRNNLIIEQGKVSLEIVQSMNWTIIAEKYLKIYENSITIN